MAKFPTTEELHEKMATALGWAVRDVQSYSLKSLEPLVRAVDAALADDINAHVREERHILTPVASKRYR
jgi:hypothetical protein